MVNTAHVHDSFSLWPKVLVKNHSTPAITPNNIEKFNIFNRPSRLIAITPRISMANHNPLLKAPAKSFLARKEISVPTPQLKIKREHKKRNFIRSPASNGSCLNAMIARPTPERTVADATTTVYHFIE